MNTGALRSTLTSRLLHLPPRLRTRMLKHTLLAGRLSNAMRIELWRSLGATVDGRAFVDSRSSLGPIPSYVTIGAGSMISGAQIVSWAPITIGQNVLISPQTELLTASHDIDSDDFRAKIAPITIEDYVWLAVGVTILPGVTIGRGAVIGARAVVGSDVPAYAVMAGNPARQVGERQRREFSYVPAEWKRPGGPGAPPPPFTEQ